MNSVGEHSGSIDRTTWRWTIRSPARLHFGLLEICPGQPKLYGGCGIALEEPATHLSVDACIDGMGDETSWRIEDAGEWQTRTESILKRNHATPDETFRANLSSSGKPASRPTLRIDRPPLAHAGLGSGTQLACSVATLVAATRQDRSSEPTAFDASELWIDSGESSESIALKCLAEATGRGARSFVGLACHLYGGFIVDSGISEFDGGGRSIQRHRIPENWSVVLARTKSSTAVSGTRENDYFTQCAAPNTNRQSMLDLIDQEMVPAIQSNDLPRFGEAVFRYGRYGGELFRAAQGGIYRDAEVTELVKEIRSWGVAATGQTSWGPSVYAIVNSHGEACALECHLRAKYAHRVATIVTRPTNAPARVTILERS